MPTCLIGLGANLGNRPAALQRAVALLERHREVRLLRVSQWRQTKPAGGPAGQPTYLNGAATVETSLGPQALLAVLQDIENQLGRRRQQRWEPRSVDLDLLLYGNHVERSSSLMVPHPRMAWRRFVLEPASEIAQSMVHPVIGWDMARLLAHLNMTPPYLAITGVVGSENTVFARRVVEACSVDGLFEEYKTMVWPSGIFGRRNTLRRFEADPSGGELSGELECLRWRARLLAADFPRWSRPKHPMVSDFWFGESRALGPCRLACFGQSLFFRLSRRLEPRVVRPRLVVFLDISARQVHRRIEQQDRPWKRSLRMAAVKQWQRALDRGLRRADVGPVLRIADPRSEESLEEVVAAIQAMA